MKTRLLNIKVTEEEKKLIKRNADLYANGNISLWLRHTGMNYKPAKLKSSGKFFR